MEAFSRECSTELGAQGFCRSFSRQVRCRQLQQLCGCRQWSRAHLLRRNQVLRASHSLVTRLHSVHLLVAAAAATEAAPPQGNNQGASNLSQMPLKIEFDNNSDPDATVISISGPDQTDLLMQLTGAFNALELTVASANIRTDRHGRIYDQFRVMDADENKIPESRWDTISMQIKSLLSASSKSSKPAIYGAAAAIEIKQLRPLAETGKLQGEAAALELAAAEMAQAATTLVSIERDIVEMVQNRSDTIALQTRETERTEAAALLERRMAAMEAVLAARRKVLTEPAKPEAARGPGADLRFGAGGGTSSGPAAGSGYEIILQGFNWDSYKTQWYKTLKSQVGAIADAGYTSVWLPPPSDSVSPQGYLPRDLYCLDSQYGTEAELRDLLSVMHENGLKAIADIVINHRCAHFQDDTGKWNRFGGRLAWDKSVICNNNPQFGGTGHHKQTEDYVAAPNVDHSQQRVKDDIKGWLKYLRNNVGFDGWRFDFVKGYAGEAVKEYVDTSVPLMAFGEFWDTCEYTDGVLNYNQDNHRQRTVNWCDKTGGTSAAFDFTTKGILQEAMARGEYWRLVDGQGRPSGLLGMWPSRAITFIANHDTDSTLNHWPFPWNHLHEGYAYILTHPGTPCVFYDHQWQDGLRQTIEKLLKIRKDMGISNRSQVQVHKASSDTYAASIDRKIAMKVGWGNWSPNEDGVQLGQKDWLLLTSGPNFAVWQAIY